MIRKLIFKLRFYFFALSCYVLVGAFLLYAYPKGEFELMINSYNSPRLDLFFTYWTYLGDGVVYAIGAGLLLFLSYYAFTIALLVGLLKTAVIQYLKLDLFNGTPRPSTYFRINFPDLKYHVVEGVEIHAFNSFPSGHTSTAFALSMVLVLILSLNRDKISVLLQFIIFFMAFLVGISRIYLMQHFFIDTYLGTIIGSLIAFIVFYFFEKTSLKNKLQNRSLLTRLK